MYGCSALTRASDEGLYPEVVELVGLGAKVSEDVAQALQATELAETGHVRPAGSVSRALRPHTIQLVDGGR